MSWCRTSIDVGEAHWHFLFKHLRGPTCWAAAPGWQDSHSSCFSWLWGIFRWTNSQCSPHMPRTSSEIPASAKPRGKQTKIELSRSSCLLSPRNTLHVMLENYFFKGDRYICSHSIRYIFHQKNKVMNLTYHFFFSEQKFLGKTHSFRVGWNPSFWVC